MVEPIPVLVSPNDQVHVIFPSPPVGRLHACELVIGNEVEEVVIGKVEFPYFGVSLIFSSF